MTQEVQKEQERALRVERRADGAAIIWFDVPGQSVNTLKAGFDQVFDDVLTELDKDENLEAVVLASAKSDSFVVGADVGLLQEVETAGEATRLAGTAQMVMDWIETFRLPIVAAIHGQCLGGGLELAMACRGRVASNHDKTKLGQPEVNVGLIPGAGGTQRLPRLVGLEPALEMILTGKEISTKKARRLGLVDEVVHPNILIDVAVERARQLARQTDKGKDSSGRRSRGALDVQRLKALVLEDNPVGRRLLFSQAREQTLSRTHGNYPAPLRALEVIQTGIEEGVRKGFEAEAEAFGELVVSSEARRLMELFFARNALKKETGTDDTDVSPRPVDKVGVLGAGLMGSGIAYVTVARAGLPVRLKDVDHAAIRQGLRSLRQNLSRRVRRGKMNEQELEEMMALVRPTTDYTGFKRADVVIEAVFEDLALKHQVLRDVEAHSPDDLIFASNTSSIPIHKIAQASTHPEQVIGMHYFSPVPRVPLLEVVVSQQTAPWVTATAVALGKQQGKTVIVVNDGPGFYTSRILAPYINEAAYLVSEGVPIDDIDRALVDFGFPVGPIKLLDDVGIDVANKIAHIMQDAFGERMAPPAGLERVVGDDRYGRKNGRGFYRYRKKNGHFERKKNGSGVDESVYELLGVEPDKKLAASEIVQRCALQMVNEAARCYGEGIVRSARDGDVGAVFGLGFPPFLGGPLRYVDTQGAGTILDRLQNYQQQFGARYQPAPILLQLAGAELGFHDEEAPASGEAS